METSSMELLTLLAIIAGPPMGVWLSKKIDKSRERTRQRDHVFQILLSSSGREFSNDYVAAVNLIPIFFQTDEKVMEAWSRLMENYYDANWSSESQDARNIVLDQCESRKKDLLDEVSSAVGISLPKRAEHRRGYAPQAWLDHEIEERRIRTGLIDILEQRRFLPVATVPVPETANPTAPPNPIPPTPDLGRDQ